VTTTLSKGDASSPSRARRLSGLALVPLILVLADVAAGQTSFKFLLLPPFGALTYLIFVNPANVHVNVRRVVICPTVAALIAWLLAQALGYNAVSVFLATVGTMAAMWALDARMVVPPLALELLTLLLHDEVRGQVGYVVSVFAFTLVIYAVYRLWIVLPLDREDVDAPGPVDGVVRS